MSSHMSRVESAEEATEMAIEFVEEVTDVASVWLEPTDTEFDDDSNRWLVKLNHSFMETDDDYEVEISRADGEVMRYEKLE